MKEEIDPLNITAKERTLLNEFRKRTTNLLKKRHDDVYLLRWLRARNFDLDKAENMLKESIKWRKQYHAEDLTDWNPPEVLSKYVPVSQIGFDKFGRPVLIIQGSIDIYGILQGVSQIDVLKYVVRMFDIIMSQMDTQTSKMGHSVHQMSIILDVEHLAYKSVTWKPSIMTIINAVKAYEMIFPELLGKAYVINGNKFFTILWAVLKPFLHENTVRKIQIYGFDKWKDDLLEDIDAEILPIHWGGTRTDNSGDPRCPTQVNLGGLVPESYYFQNSKDLQSRLNEMDTITVKKGDSMQMQYEVKAGHIIKWTFKTEDHDIGFGIKIRSKLGIESDLIPVSKFNCNIVPEEGFLLCKEAGTHIVIFDNSHSYFRRKKIYYKIKVQKGCDDDDDNK